MLGMENTTHTEQDQTYNGYANFATWGVALVLDNEQETQEWTQALAFRAIRGAAEYLDDPDNAGSPLTIAKIAPRDLADDLKDYVETLCGLEDEPGPSLMARQVIQAGLADVDWREIADNILDGIKS